MVWYKVYEVVHMQLCCMLCIYDSMYSNVILDHCDFRIVYNYLSDLQEGKDSVAKLKSSVLNLVDLAGSERQRDTQTAGVRLKVQCDA